MLCPELPSPERAGTMAPTLRQFQSLQAIGIDVTTVDMRGIPRLKYLTLLPKVRRLLPQVDIVHAHFGYCGWLARLARVGVRPKTPIVMSYMGDELLGVVVNAEGKITLNSHWIIRLNKWLAGTYDRVIVKSQQMADLIPHVRCDVVPNGVDLEAFSPSDRVEACKSLGISPEGYTVFFPGNPANPRKGFALANEAIQYAENKLGQSIRVLTLGGVPPEKVPIYMNASHAMLMTSVTEGSPNVVKEAMATNLPTIGVPVGDVHWLLNGVENCYCSSRKVEELGEALAQALIRNQRSSGREVAISRGIDLDSIARRIENIYQEVISANHDTPR